MCICMCAVRIFYIAKLELMTLTKKRISTKVKKKIQIEFWLIKYRNTTKNIFSKRH